METATVQTLGRKDPIARYPHVCDCCKSTIHPGQKYTRIFFLHNGKPKVLKHHTTTPDGDDQCEWKKRGSS